MQQCKTYFQKFTHHELCSLSISVIFFPTSREKSPYYGKPNVRDRKYFQGKMEFCCCFLQQQKNLIFKISLLDTKFQNEKKNTASDVLNVKIWNLVLLKKFVFYVLLSRYLSTVFLASMSEPAEYKQNILWI